MDGKRKTAPDGMKGKDTEESERRTFTQASVSATGIGRRYHGGWKAKSSQIGDAGLVPCYLLRTMCVHAQVFLLSVYPSPLGDAVPTHCDPAHCNAARGGDVSRDLALGGVSVSKTDFTHCLCQLPRLPRLPRLAADRSATLIRISLFASVFCLTVQRFGPVHQRYKARTVERSYDCLQQTPTTISTFTAAFFRMAG